MTDWWSGHDTTAPPPSSDNWWGGHETTGSGESIPPSPAAQPPQPSLLDAIKSAATGEGRTEFPDAQEFGGALLARTDPKFGDASKRLDYLQTLNRSGVTPDQKARLDILTKRIPGLESMTDKFGNVMLRLPSEGLNDWTYLSKPGFSRQGVQDFLTQSLVTAPFFGLMGVGGSVLGKVGVGAIAGAGGSIAQDLLAGAQGSQQGIDPTRAAVSAGIGGAASPLFASPGTQAVKTVTQLPPTARDQLIQDAADINVTLPRFMASENELEPRGAASLKSMPFAGEPVVEAAKQVGEGLDTAAKSAEAGFGSGSVVNAGADAGDALGDWITGKSKSITGRAYQPVDAMVDDTVAHDLPATRATVANIAASRQASRIDQSSAAAAQVLNAVTDPNGLTYSGIKGLRTFVGEKTPLQMASQGISDKENKAIYAALTNDLRSAVGTNGPRALTAFDRATSIADDVFARREQLAKIIGVDGDAPAERVFSRIMAMAKGTSGGKPVSSADIMSLGAARKAAGPDAWNQIASAAVHHLGRDASGNFSPDRFITAYDSLSDAGRNLLFRSTGRDSLADSLQKIRNVSLAVKDKITKFSNPSGTGHTVVGAGLLLEGVKDPFTLAASMIGGRTLATLMSRPATANTVARWSTTYQNALFNRTPANLALYTAASNELSKLAVREHGQP